MWFTERAGGRIGRIAAVVVAPDAPTALTATAGNGEAAVTWSAPVWDGNGAITAYTVSASGAGGQTCAWTSGPLECTVTGLTNGTNYTFTVAATNGAGTGSASAPSNAVTPTAPATPTPGPTATATPTTHADADADGRGAAGPHRPPAAVPVGPGPDHRADGRSPPSTSAQRASRSASTPWPPAGCAGPWTSAST